MPRISSVKILSMSNKSGKKSWAASKTVRDVAARVKGDSKKKKY